MGSMYRDSFGLQALPPISTQMLHQYGRRARPQMPRWEHLHAEREFQDALKQYAKRKDKNLRLLMQYAQAFQVERILDRYLEVLLQ